MKIILEDSILYLDDNSEVAIKIKKGFKYNIVDNNIVFTNEKNYIEFFKEKINDKTINQKDICDCLLYLLNKCSKN